MIHDFATTPRQTDWRADSSGTGLKSAKEKVSVTSNGSAKKVLSIVLAVCVALLLVQKIILTSDPILDQQPDQEAKREYAEALLFTESDSQDDDLVSRETIDVSQGSLKTLDDAPVTVRIDKASSVSNEPVAHANLRAEPVETDYGFYDSLKQGSWPVPVNKGTYVDGDLANRVKPIYKLQAASFRSQSDAYRLVSKLNKQKLRAIVVESVSTSGEFWYQVSVGPFVNTSKLNKAQDILVSLGMMPLKKRVN